MGFIRDYEFVIVDGGSDDGTIDWCKTQPDIRLIEQGELFGAVAAFNTGAKNARGIYTILANDDISFIGDSIWKAYIHMQNDVDSYGIGCFYQDRGGHDWHVETMPVIIDNKQRAAWYGQVCIIPTWLGNHVNWWGTYLRTYGGDNEISAQVYELGYKIYPVEGAKIHDHEIDDKLRKLNNISGGHDPKAVHGHHPDSYMWGRRWKRRNRLVGPYVADRPLIESQTPQQERVLYLPIYEPGWQVQKEQKYGLCKALERLGPTVEIDYLEAHGQMGHNGMIKHILDVGKQLRPTLVVSQIHNDGQFSAHDVQQLKLNFNYPYWANWNGDYWPDNLTPEGCLSINRQCDFVGLVNREMVEHYRGLGINAYYWQIGWEPEGTNVPPSEHNEIVFLANGYSKERRRFVKNARQLLGDIAIWGSGWPNGWSRGQSTYDFRAAAGVYAGAKFALGDSQWPQSGFVSNRLFQILAAGNCVLTHQWFDRIEELGLKDMENCIIWHTLHELKNKIDYLRLNEAIRVEIANRGHQLAMERHSFNKRVEELMLIKNREVHIDNFTDWR